MNIPFERVVAEHGPMILRLCRALAGSWHADDVWSETFLSALRAYPDLPADANVAAWLVTIAKRKAIDAARAERRDQVGSEALRRAQSTDSRQDASDADLLAALRALPERQREAVAYRYLAGLRYADVAEVIGGTEAAARRAAADGIQRLRRTYPGGMA